MQSENTQTKKVRSQVNWKKVAAQAGVTFAQGALFAAGGLLVNRMSTMGQGAPRDLSNADSNVLPLKKQAHG